MNDPVSISEIARRLTIRVTRQHVTKLLARPGAPKPIDTPVNGLRVWEWEQVAPWIDAQVGSRPMMVRLAGPEARALRRIAEAERVAPDELVREWIRAEAEQLAKDTAG